MEIVPFFKKTKQKRGTISGHFPTLQMKTRCSTSSLPLSYSRSQSPTLLYFSWPGWSKLKMRKVLLDSISSPKIKQKIIFDLCVCHISGPTHAVLQLFLFYYYLWYSFSHDSSVSYIFKFFSGLTAGALRKVRLAVISHRGSAFLLLRKSLYSEPKGGNNALTAHYAESQSHPKWL